MQSCKLLDNNENTKLNFMEGFWAVCVTEKVKIINAEDLV